MIEKMMKATILLIILTACQVQDVGPITTSEPTFPADTPTTEIIVEPTLTNTPTAKVEPTVTKTPTSSPTIIPSPQISPSPTTTPTEQPSSTPSNVRPPDTTTSAIIVDHTTIPLFDQIPDEYIQKASELRLLFRHASIGWNMDFGLNCLMNVEQPRPHGCDKNVPAGEIRFDNKYDRSNWIFEYHLPPPRQNPGWYAKVGLFIDRIDNLGPDEVYDFAAFKLGYVDAMQGSEISEVFFHPEVDSGSFPTIKDIEDLEARHPDITLIYWTIGLARQSTPESESFNKQLREYIRANNKILMDIADIESHRPDGTPCFSNLNNGVEAICEDYTDELNAGHLNAFGRTQMAKAFWIMMSRLAGWDGQPIQ